MSTTVQHTSKACCSIPTVQSDYNPKGSYVSYGDFKKVYVTGPQTSDNSLIAVYDIFGFFPQTQQGADMIATALKTKVYMPDFFEPHPPFPTAKHPPKTDQDRADFNTFFGTTANKDEMVRKLTKFAQTLKRDGAKKVGAYGFCWGAKIVIVTAGEGTPLDAAAMVHPAALSVEDAEKLTVPLATYISNDEPIAEYRKIVDVISKKPFAPKNDSKHYENMFHGWAAARADHSNEDNKREFADVYKRLVTFFENTLA